MFVHCFSRERNFICLLVSLLVVLLAAAGTVHASGPGHAPCVVAVIDFENETGAPENANFARSLTDAVTTSMVKSGSLQVVERSRLKKIIDEQKLMLSGMVDTSMVANVGRLLSADNIVIGSLSLIEKKWMVNIRVLEVKTGRVLGSELFDAGDRKKLLKITQAIAHNLVRVINHYRQRTNVRMMFLAKPRGNEKNRLTPEEETQMKRVVQQKIEGYGARLKSANMDGERLTLSVQEVFEPLVLAEMLMTDDILEFRLIADAYEPNTKTQPAGTEPMFCHPGDNKWISAVYVNPVMTGEHIAQTSVVIDNYNQPSINLVFNQEGTGIFASITGGNIGKSMAIVLNGTCLAAPRIQEAITGGKAQITGRFNMTDAFRLSVSLKSGKTPAQLSLEGMDNGTE